MTAVEDVMHQAVIGQARRTGSWQYERVCGCLDLVLGFLQRRSRWVKLERTNGNERTWPLTGQGAVPVIKR